MGTTRRTVERIGGNMGKHKRGIFEAQQPYGPGWYRIWGKRGEQVNTLDVNKGDIPDLIALLEDILCEEENIPLTGAELGLLVRLAKAEVSPETYSGDSPGFDEWWHGWCDRHMGDSPTIVENSDDKSGKIGSFTPADCSLKSPEHRLTELEEVVAKVWAEHKSEAAHILEVGMIDDIRRLQSSHAVLREQVRELAGKVEKLKDNQWPPLQGRQILAVTCEHKCPYCGTVTYPVVRDNVTPTGDASPLYDYVID